MIKRLTILCLAVTAFAMIPVMAGCGGRPPAPKIDEESKNIDFGKNPDEGKTVTHQGQEKKATDELQPID